MILAAIAMISIQDTAQAAPPALTCAILGTPVTSTGPAVDYKGVRYNFCCTDCSGTFQKDPNAAINSDKVKGKTIGTFLFDPVTDSRISAAQSKAWTDYKGVRYLFTSDDEKNTFTASPDKYTAIPAKEALYCPVQKTKLSGYAAAGSYRDYEGVRYYFCCANCPTDFMKTPDVYAKNASDYVMAPKAIIPAAEKTDTATASDYPATFTCKHCGKMITANSADDMSATCSVCGCGKKVSDCKGQ